MSARRPLPVWGAEAAGTRGASAPDPTHEEAAMPGTEDQDKTHPLEEVTGERDVPPEEDEDRKRDEDPAQHGDDSEGR